MLVREIHVVRAARPGDPFPLHAMLTVLRLHQYVECRQEAAEAAERQEYQALTDGELKARTRDAIIKLIRDKPDVALGAAQLLGWIVIPPSGDEPRC